MTEMFAKAAHFFTRQCFAFHCDGSNYNFMKLFHLYTEENAKVVDWVKYKKHKVYIR